MLTESPQKIESGADPELLARESQIRREINSTVAQLLLGHATAAASAKLEERQRALLLELAEIDSQLRSRKPQLAALAKPPALTVPGIQKLIGKWGLLLVYSLGEERSFLWSLAGDGKIASYSLPSRASLEEMAEQVRSAWGHRGGDHGPGARWAARLSKELLGPVAGILGDKRLLIVGDGALETVPFAALPDPRALSDSPKPDVAVEPLVAHNEVVHLPSIATLATLRSRKRLAPPPGWLGIVADPVFAANDPRVKKGTATGGTIGTILSPNLGRATEDLGQIGRAHV